MLQCSIFYKPPACFHNHFFAFSSRSALNKKNSFTIFICLRRSPSPRKIDSSEIRVVSRGNVVTGLIFGFIICHMKIEMNIFFFPFFLIKSKMEYGKWTASTLRRAQVTVKVSLIPSSSGKLMESSSNYERKVLDIKIATLWVWSWRRGEEKRGPSPMPGRWQSIDWMVETLIMK